MQIMGEIAEAEAEPVPEPASIALWSILGVVAMGFGVRRWRKR